MNDYLRKAVCAAAILVLTTGVSWAVDCQSQYNQAIMMIGGIKQKALNNEKLNPDSFSSQFKITVDGLQKGQCLNELMALMKFIQEEQKQYPAPPGSPQVPKI